jgi:hypothetical protein
MATAKEEAKTKTVASDGMELVKAFYPDIPGTHYSGDIQVGINGKMFLVKRGEEVEIPRCVKEVIDWSMSEDQKTEKKLAELEGR